MIRSSRGNHCNTACVQETLLQVASFDDDAQLLIV